MRDLGVKQAPFVVLIGAGMPSVLAEISFLTNQQEGQLLKTPAYRQQIAEALFDGRAEVPASLKAVTAASRPRTRIRRVERVARCRSRVERGRRAASRCGTQDERELAEHDPPMQRAPTAVDRHRSRPPSAQPERRRPSVDAAGRPMADDTSTMIGDRSAAPTTRTMIGASGRRLGSATALSRWIERQLRQRADGDAGRALRLPRLAPRRPTRCRRCRGAPTAASPANSFRNIAAVHGAGRPAAGVASCRRSRSSAARVVVGRAASASTDRRSRADVARTRVDPRRRAVPNRPVVHLARARRRTRRSASRRRPGASRRAAARTRARRRGSAGPRRRC